MPTGIYKRTESQANLGSTIGSVFYGEISLKSVAAGNVPSIVIYQMHINYHGIKA